MMSNQELNSYYPRTVASQMKRGLENELQKICEIGKVLCELGNSRREVSYYMNVDEDFIPDVLSCYNHKECHRNCRDTEYGFFLSKRG